MILKSLTPAYGGYSIARDDKVILIRGAVPGELVEVRIDEKKRDYSIATVTNVVEPSEFRVEPSCSVFGVCGGCQLQYISYEKQVRIKDEIILDSLARLGGIETALEQPLTGGQWKYRHRAQFKISREGAVGFFRQATREVVTFESCPLMIDEINGLLAGLKGSADVERLKEIHVASGDSNVALLLGRDHDSKLVGNYDSMGLSGLAYNDVLISGRGYMNLELNGLTYAVSPWTFFQAHWSLNREVEAFLTSSLAPLEGKRVLDLYAGAGNFSLGLARHCEEVVAVEENPRASEDGVRNLEINNIKNCRIVRASAEKYRIQKKFDIIILDPPRPGLSSEVARKILENPSDLIVYISCNPATFARDLKKLKEKYDIQSIRQIDFFPNTFHVESVAFLAIR